MTTITLKLPDELKRRIEALAASARKSPNALMVDALEREAARLELRARFATDSAQVEARVAGKAIPLDAAFDYLEARAAGAKARRPRARQWRRSR